MKDHFSLVTFCSLTFLAMLQFILVPLFVQPDPDHQNDGQELSLDLLMVPNVHFIFRDLLCGDFLFFFGLLVTAGTGRC